MGFVAEAGKLGGRPKKPRVIDALHEAVEREAERIVAAYLDGLSHDDQALRIKAADALLDRVHGKPTQRSEVEMSGTLTLDQLYADQPNAHTDTPLGGGQNDA